MSGNCGAFRSSKHFSVVKEHISHDKRVIKRTSLELRLAVCAELKHTNWIQCEFPVASQTDAQFYSLPASKYLSSVLSEWNSILGELYSRPRQSGVWMTLIAAPKECNTYFSPPPQPLMDLCPNNVADEKKCERFQKHADSIKTAVFLTNRYVVLHFYLLYGRHVSRRVQWPAVLHNDLTRSAYQPCSWRHGDVTAVWAVDHSELPGRYRKFSRHSTFQRSA